MITTPVLAMLNFLQTIHFNLLMLLTRGHVQSLNRMDHPFAYVSKTLGPKSQGLFTYAKECLATLLVVDH
jgi:hypothetical protein